MLLKFFETYYRLKLMALNLGKELAMGVHISHVYVVSIMAAYQLKAYSSLSLSWASLLMPLLLCCA